MNDVRPFDNRFEAAVGAGDQPRGVADGVCEPF
jgi:hypothetical protein